MRQLAGLILAAFSTACVKHAPRSTASLFPEPVTIIGHRGARDLAPENTMAGFALAVEEYGVGFELDVHRCATGEVVVIHDEDLARTTSGSGFVDQAPLDAIRGLDAGTHFDARFAGEPVPTLRETLARFGQQVVIDVEIKNPRTPEEVQPLAHAVVDEIEAAGLVDRVLVTSFNPYLLEAVRLRNPAIARGQLTGTFARSDLPWIQKVALRNLWLNGKAQPDVLAVESARLSKRYVRRMRRKGYRVMAWTVDDPAEMRTLIDWGVTGIITDRPDLALQLLGTVQPPDAR